MPGEIIQLFTLRNGTGSRVTVSNYGAIVTSMKLQRGGSPMEVMLGFEKMEDYRSPAYLSRYPWFGCVVGRYANRIANASFILDGKRIQLAANNGKHQLHGGPEGFDKKTWSVREQGNAFITMALRSPDGDQGYPGNLDAQVRYELTENDGLKITLTATCDKPTPCNLTHHAYFNLDNATGSILDHDVRIPAAFCLEQNEDLVATGNLVPVENTAYDLRAFRKIGEGQKSIPEYDKSFVVDAPGNEIRLVSEARHLPQKLLLQVYSTCPVVHFYSGKWIPEVSAEGGKNFGPWSGFCLETHGFPNAVNIPRFPTTILRPGQVYRQETEYRFIQL